MEHDIAAHSAQIANLEKVADMIVLWKQESLERITKVEASSRSSEKRLDAIQEQTEAVIKLAVSVEYLAKSVESVVSLTKEHSERLDVLERSPGDTFIYYKRLATGAAITLLIGYVFGKYFV